MKTKKTFGAARAEDTCEIFFRTKTVRVVLRIKEIAHDGRVGASAVLCSRQCFIGNRRVLHNSCRMRRNKYYNNRARRDDVPDVVCSNPIADFYPLLAIIVICCARCERERKKKDFFFFIYVPTENICVRPRPSLYFQVFTARVYPFIKRV